MGSKSKIMDFVLEGINEVYQGGQILDLFSGSGSLAGAIGHQAPVWSNDIQSYSAVLADTYNQAYSDGTMPRPDEIIKMAKDIVDKNKRRLNFRVDYNDLSSLEEYNKFEELQKKLIGQVFHRKWHLFLKYYSGTWWSAEQCLWIDAIREVAETYKDKPYFPAILSSLMFAMAYASQGTGHYAQYRDAKTASSLKDILIYRKRSVAAYFFRKYNDLCQWLPETKPLTIHKSTALDYKECLRHFRGGLVYADPPYCFVHYSRFYHAIETLVKYDYPSLQEKNGEVVKGRYRENRHQSPFSIQSKVKDAFHNMFVGVEESNSNLVLSYSNTGMITMDEVEEIAFKVFNNKRIEILTTDHQHMTLGRQKDRHREVKECLILVS